jgi:polysaccharide biosynthesis protein PslH
MPRSDRHSNGAPLPRRQATGDRPQALFLSCHLPWPPLSGGRRRELELITRVAARFDIRLVVVSKTAEQDEANAEMLAPFCRSIEVFSAHPAEARGRHLPHQVRRHRSPAATRRVRKIIAYERVDLVHVEGFYLMQHVPDWLDVPLLLVEQNVEYELARQRARAGAGRVARLDSFFECARTEAAERAALRRANRLATVTWEDRELIRAEVPGADVSVVPDGADHLPSWPGEEPSPPRMIDRPSAPLVTLLANFAYAPNVDAALHFCHDILPLLRAAVPDVHVRLVGNAPPPEIQALGDERVAVTGYVPDVVPHLDTADVVVCPLRIGGGIKVKVIEALRRGKAIVCTGIGAQGLPAQARDALVVADDPRQFANAVAELLCDGQRRARFERRAAAAARSLPTWDQAAGALAAVYDELLELEPGRTELAGSHLAGRSA